MTSILPAVALQDPATAPRHAGPPRHGPGAPSVHPGTPPLVELGSLDVLWVQVAGTICNLTCSHCFISCGPGNRSFEMMLRADVERLLEAAARGVRDTPEKAARTPYPLRHQACSTCWLHGAICSNPASGLGSGG